AAGGVLITKSKLLSEYTVINTGSVFPILSCVLALNCLQNSMILIPLEPNAGPIGGAGLAWPPLHCSFTKPVISFAIFYDLLVQTTFLPSGLLGLPNSSPDGGRDLKELMGPQR